MIHNYYVYMLSSKRNGTLYIGVTSDLVRRVYPHKNDLTDGFTKRYGVHNLVWYEMDQSPESAIKKEKELKKWRRAWKLALIEQLNPDWKDLYEELLWGLDSRVRGNDREGIRSEGRTIG